MKRTSRITVDDLFSNSFCRILKRLPRVWFKVWLLCWVANKTESKARGTHDDIVFGVIFLIKVLHTIIAGWVTLRMTNKATFMFENTSPFYVYEHICQKGPKVVTLFETQDILKKIRALASQCWDKLQNIEKRQQLTCRNAAEPSLCVHSPHYAVLPRGLKEITEWTLSAIMQQSMCRSLCREWVAVSSGLHKAGLRVETN